MVVIVTQSLIVTMDVIMVNRNGKKMTIPVLVMTSGARRHSFTNTMTDAIIAATREWAEKIAGACNPIKPEAGSVVNLCHIRFRPVHCHLI